MIADLKPYPAMTDSDIEWLGEVPKHWDLERGKALFAKVDRPVRDTDEVITCFRDGTVTLRKNRRIRGFTESLKEIGYQGIHAGDLVIHAMDAFAGAVGVADSDGKGTPVYAVCEPRPGVDAHYHAFVIREMARSQWILALATGIRERSTDFRFGTYAVERVPLPPLSEQTAIVRYLDHVNDRVRRLVRTKRKLIALLKEQKQAIIHRAVTRGLDPGVSMKDSGVEWLGEVPEHWGVTRVKTEFTCLNSRRVPLSAQQRGAMTSRAYDYYGASGPIDKVEDYLFEDELLLIAEDGANLMLRNLPLAIIARGRFWVNNHAHILKPNRGNLEYLAAAMESLNYNPWISGAAQPKLTKDRIMAIAIAVPLPEEQDEIIESLQAETSSLDAAITRAEREVELLGELRTRLIADVVTGKLDVREAVAALPEIDPLEADDEPDELDTDGELELEAEPEEDDE